MALRHTRTRREPPQDLPAPGLGLLLFAAAPMILWIFRNAWPGLLAALLLMGLFALALRLIAQGQQVQARYDAATVANRPRLPRKLMGSAMIGLLVMMLSAAQFTAPLAPQGLGLLGFALAVAAFGADPLRDKGTDTPEFQLRQSSAALIAKTERSLAQIFTQIDALGDADLTRQTERMGQALLRLLRAVAQDPEALRDLHTPLMTFLQMARFEADRLTELWSDKEQRRARARYLAKLSALSHAFEHRAGGLQGTARDALAAETDLLLHRMTQESAV